MLKTPGIEASTGTLGLGLSTACGMALAAKHKGETQRYFVLCGDGEQQEGQIWEAGMLGAKYKLSNLFAFTDRNMLQTDGNTEDVMPLEPLADKWKAFGWHTQVIDGHNKQGILDALGIAAAVTDRPHMIILNTIKGKGVSFMENEAMWHGTPPTPEQKAKALEELTHGI
jgi:transketolase